MGFVQKKGGDEGGGGGSGLELDLDLKACSTCRRELLPWQDTCPDDGGAAVPKTQLQADDPVAARLAALLDDEDPDGPDDGTPADEA
jgi:hypothetical protein